MADLLIVFTAFSRSAWCGHGVSFHFLSGILSGIGVSGIDLNQGSVDDGMMCAKHCGFVFLQRNRSSQRDGGNNK
jgi:hypothetical protein